MEGGIHAWKGLVSEGSPESGMIYFSPATKPEELMALAWYLEYGAFKFYSEMFQISEDREAKDLFEWLATGEDRHKASLLELYRKFSGAMSDQGFPGSVISLGREGDVMEGGIPVSEALKWVKGKEMEDILAFSLSLETHTYDLFLKMGRQVEDQKSEEVFQVLAKETKEHLERLSSFLEKRI
jgi:sulfur-carrier protein adenylyltransferase/sulfurtransferase